MLGNLASLRVPFWWSWVALRASWAVLGAFLGGILMGFWAALRGVLGPVGSLLGGLEGVGGPERPRARGGRGARGGEAGRPTVNPPLCVYQCLPPSPLPDARLATNKRDFPLSSKPFAAITYRAGITRAVAMTRFARLFVCTPQGPQGPADDGKRLGA